MFSWSLALLFSVLTFSTGLSEVSAHPQTGRTIDVLRRSRKTWTLEEFRDYIVGVHMKYNKTIPIDKRASGTDLLTDLGADSSYFGTILVGTPPVSYNVILDTGSSDLWLASSQIPSDSQADSPSIKTYIPSASSTSVRLNIPFDITYGSGQASGELFQETVQWAGFGVSGQTFGVVNRTTADIISAPASGLMGLAFQTISSSGALPLWQSLMQTAGTLDSPVMGVWLTRFTNDSSAQLLEPGGSITIGATDSTLFTGNIDFQDIPDGTPGFWTQSLIKMTVSGQIINVPLGNAAFAAIDTGTTGIGAPASVVSQVYSLVQGSARQGQFFSIPCNANVSISFTFGASSNSWTISPDDFNLGEVSPGECLGAIFEVDSTAGSATPNWIIGDTFLKNVYTVFRQSPPSVGFATLSAKALSVNATDSTSAIPSISVPNATASPRATSKGVSTSACSMSRILSGVASVAVTLSVPLLFAYL